MAVVDFSLEGRTAVVTGGSRGIGRSIAIALGEAGANVVIGARKQESLDEAVAAVEATGARALGVVTNVREMDALTNLVRATREAFGRLDVLVNNAGTNPVAGPIANVDERAWDVILNTNLRSVFFLSKLAREAMIEQGGGGSIVNISSTSGLRAGNNLGAYSVSKAGLLMLTRVLAAEWGADGIRVNAVAPGLIRTEFSRAMWERPNGGGEIGRGLARIGEPDEIAGAVLYLASGASSFVTGATLLADGGALA
jgi:dehydrogenase/reductase SDR family protein 4